MELKKVLCGTVLTFTLFLNFSQNAWSLNDTMARTPPMGWNSWNLFKSNPTEAKVKAIADAFVTSGLKDAGYRYIVVDDCWSNASRDGSGTLVAQSSKFPSGMKSLADYVHGKGLKFGMYACPTSVTCCGMAGTLTHETKDAQTFTGWGVDYLKYDWCGVQSGDDATNITAAQIIARYVTMREALKATNRPILYALCEKGQKSKIVPGTWSDTVGHMWRIGGDITATWSSITSHIDANATLYQYAGPTQGWNDPDMLEVGNGSLTDDEDRMHFSMWCIMAAPLILGNDPSTMPAVIKTIVTNKEAIALNQDSLGLQGVRIKKTGEQEIWVKPLQNGDRGVALFNRAASATTITVNWTDSLIKWGASAKVTVRNIWTAKDSLSVTNGFSASVASHAAVLLRLKNPATGIFDDGAGISGTVIKDITIRTSLQGIVILLPGGNRVNKVEVANVMGRTMFTGVTSGDRYLIPKTTLAPGVNIIRITSMNNRYVHTFFNAR